MKRGRPAKDHLNQAEYYRLLEITGRRAKGQTWEQVAQAMGWSSKQGAWQWHRWASRIAQPEEVTS